MDRALVRKLKLFTAGLVVAGYWSLASSEPYGLGLVILPLLVFFLMPIGEYLDHRFRWYRQVTTYLTLGLMALMVGYLAAMVVGVIAFDLLGPVTLLVMYIQTYELVHVKEERNYLHIFLMAFFMLVAASVQAPHAGISLTLFLFIVSAVGALMMLQLYRDSRRSRHGPEGIVITLNHPHPSYAAGGEQASPKRMELALSLTAISAASILLTTAVFYTTPRTEAGLFGRSQPGESVVTGLSGAVDLTLRGNITEDASVVFQAEFPDEPDGRYGGTMRWRAGTLDTYTGRSWAYEGVEAVDVEAPQPEFEKVDDGTVTRTPVWEEDPALVHQVIRMEGYSYAHPFLPGLSLIKRLEADNMTVEWRGGRDFSVMKLTEGRAEPEYEVWSEVGEPEPGSLRDTHSDYQTIFEEDEYRRLTRQDLQDRTLRLVNRVAGDQETVYDQVVAIEEYLSSPDFVYSLEAPTLPSDNPMDAFIHDYRAGHCEYFASAMALMVRSLGTPARLVMGYRGGAWDEEEEAYLVRADMAHVWVEVYFPGWGWISFDPSPLGDSEDEDGVWVTLNRWANTVHIQSRMLWYRDIIGYEPTVRLEHLFNLPRWFSGIVPAWVQSGEVFRGMKLTDRIPLATAGLSILGLGGVGVWFAVQWKELQFLARRPRVRLSRDQVRAIRLYLRLCRRLRHTGIQCEGKTAQEILEEARGRPGVDAGVLEELVAVYDTVRFGNRSLDARRYRALRRAMKRLFVREDWKPVATVEG